MKMRYAVIGTGAVGGYYGGMLAKAGFDVHFLLHSDYGYVCEHGLVVDSWRESFVIARPKAYRDIAAMPQCDVVLVALKSTVNHTLPRLLRPLLGSHTLVVLIQNGIGLEADLQDALPEAQIAAGLAYICAAKTAPGHISHMSNGALTIGNYSCRDIWLMNGLLADLATAGIKATVADYGQARWRKAMWNMPFNGLSVVLGTTTDRLIVTGPAEKLVRSLMDEVSAAALACGVAGVDGAYAEKMMAMTHRMPPYSPSMKLDWDCGRPMEVHYLYTRPIEEARKAGCLMPRMEMLEAQLLFMERERGIVQATRET